MVMNSMNTLEHDFWMELVLFLTTGKVFSIKKKRIPHLYMNQSEKKNSFHFRWKQTPDPYS